MASLSTFRQASQQAWASWGRALIVALALFGFMGIVVGRLVNVQLINSHEFKDEALGNYTKKRTIQARRGTIWDRNGEILANSEDVRNVRVDPTHLREVNTVSRRLARIENDIYRAAGDKRRISPNDIIKKYHPDDLLHHYRVHVVKTIKPYLEATTAELLEQIEVDHNRPIILREKMGLLEATELQETMTANHITGVYLDHTQHRDYPSPEHLAHVIGYAVESDPKDTDYNRRTYVGKDGLEKSFDKLLRGQDGYEFYQAAAGGHEVPGATEREPSVNGFDIHLTIDMGIQNIVEKALDEAMVTCKTENLCVVIMDPRTGEILASGSRPNFSLKTLQSIQRNHVIHDLYEPGSTFKIIPSAAYLGSGGSVHATRFCPRRLVDGSVKITDPLERGNVNLFEILAHSSNVGIYRIAREAGYEEFYATIGDFGFGEPTGSGLAGELAGSVPQFRKTDFVSCSALSRGYGLEVTPLQMVTALCAVANGGELLTPRIVGSITDDQNEVVKNYQTETRRRVLSPTTAKQLTEALVAVVSNGTATRAAIHGHIVAGKTGTAQKVINGYYTKGRYVASFMGFAPADDPRLAAIVVVDDPMVDDVTERFGGKRAAPIFSQIISQALDYLDVPATRKPRIIR